MSFVPSWYETDIPKISPDNRALSVLNLASNGLGGWNDSNYYSKYDTSGNTNNVPYCFTSVYVHIPAGIIALTGAIPDMGAMASLNLASNKLGVEGAKIIAACLPKCT
jgi:hypothetical protein